MPSAFDTLADVRRLRSVGVSQDLRHVEFRLTMRLGGLVGVSVAIAAALTKLR